VIIKTGQSKQLHVGSQPEGMCTASAVSFNSHWVRRRRRYLKHSFCPTKSTWQVLWLFDRLELEWFEDVNVTQLIMTTTIKIKSRW